MDKVKKVFNIALPVVIEMLLYMLVGVVDTAFVGHYGGNRAVSAVGYSTEIVYMFVNVFISMGIGVGITALVAQNIGAGNKDKAEEYLSQGIVICLIIAVLVSAMFFLFSKEILTIARADKNIIVPASGFMQIVAFGAFFNMVSSGLNAGLRGKGNTVTPLIASLIINVVTICLDYTLIYGHFGFRSYGIRGSAIATSIAYFSGFTFLCIYLLKHSDFSIRFRYIREINKGMMNKIIKLALPASLQEAAFSVSRVLSLMFIMHLGTVAFSANTITTTVESISFMPGWGFAVAATTLTGQMIGLGDYNLARQYTKIAMIMGVSLMMLCAVMFLIFPVQLMHLFINEGPTIEAGKYCLMLAALEQPFTSLSMVYEGSLKGSGDTRTPFIISLSVCWLVRVPLMYYVIYILKLNVAYVWVITAVQWALEGIIVSVIYLKKSRNWEKTLKRLV